MQGNWRNADSDWQLRRLQQDSVKSVDKVLELLVCGVQDEVMRVNAEYEQMFGPSSAQFTEYLNMVMERFVQSGIANHDITQWLAAVSNSGDFSQSSEPIDQFATLSHIKDPWRSSTQESLMPVEDANNNNPWLGESVVGKPSGNIATGNQSAITTPNNTFLAPGPIPLPNRPGSSADYQNQQRNSPSGTFKTISMPQNGQRNSQEPRKEDESYVFDPSTAWD
jgi:hypothetical protein